MDKLCFGPDGITILGKVCCVGLFIIGVVTICLCNWVYTSMDPVWGSVFVAVFGIIGALAIVFCIDISLAWKNGMKVF